MAPRFDEEGRPEMSAEEFRLLRDHVYAHCGILIREDMKFVMERRLWPRLEALGLPDFAYSPDPDGEADPGEVVWAWVPFEEDPAQGKDRPVLVLARHETRLVVAQMTSKDHDRDAAQEARWGRFWHDVGTGDWDRQGRPSEVRLDRLLLVEPASVRREGATMKREIFDGVVAALRHHHS